MEIINQRYSLGIKKKSYIVWLSYNIFSGVIAILMDQSQFLKLYYAGNIFRFLLSRIREYPKQWIVLSKSMKSIIRLRSYRIIDIIFYPHIILNEEAKHLKASLNLVTKLMLTKCPHFISRCNLFWHREFRYLHLGKPFMVTDLPHLLINSMWLKRWKQT